MSVRIPGVGTPISEGEVELKSEDWNDSHSYHLDLSSEVFKGEIKNTIRQLQDRAVSFSGDGDDVWAEAYVNSSGRMNSVYSSLTTYDTGVFESRDPNNVAVLIEADSISSLSDFNINNCSLTKISQNTWLLISSSSSVEVQRSEIYKTLYYGTNGSDYRVSNTYITNLISLKTNVDRDDGKKAFIVEMSASRNTLVDSSVSSRVLDITFDDTSNNDAVSVWTNWNASTTDNPDGTIGLFDWIRVELPNNNYYINVNPGRNFSGSENFIGTDEQEFEVTNPVNAQLSIRVDSSNSNGRGANLSAKTLLMSSSTFQSNITEQNGSQSSASLTLTDINSEVVNSSLVYQDFDVENLIFHNLPSVFENPITKSLGTVLYDDWEEGNNIEYKFVDSSDNETDWLITNTFSSFSEITPNRVVVKLNPKETSPTTGFPSIKGFGFKAWND